MLARTQRDPAVEVAVEAPPRVAKQLHAGFMIHDVLCVCVLCVCSLIERDSKSADDYLSAVSCVWIVVRRGLRVSVLR